MSLIKKILDKLSGFFSDKEAKAESYKKTKPPKSKPPEPKVVTPKRIKQKEATKEVKSDSPKKTTPLETKPPEQKTDIPNSTTKPKDVLPTRDIPTHYKKVPKKQPARQERTLNIGIDMGTDSTKVVYQIVEEGKAHVFNFNLNNENYPTYSLPSIITIDDKKLFFGDEKKSQKAGAISFTSFKMCIACYTKIIDCKECSKIGMNNFNNGQYNGKEYQLNVYDLCIYYLAYIINTVTSQLNLKYQKKFILHHLYNFSFPTNYLDSNKEYFDKLVITAEKISGSLVQGISFNEANKILNSTKNVSTNGTIEGEKNVFVVPETSAAMQSFKESNYLNQGIYSVVDVGAGTTDISIFKLDNSAEKLVYYADESHLIGGDDFDIKIKESLNPPNGEISLTHIKHAKNELQRNNELRLINMESITIEDLVSIVFGLQKNIHEKFSETLRLKACDKYKSVTHFLNIKIIPIGGGSMFPGITEILTRYPFKGSGEWKPEIIEPELPDNLVMDDKTINEYTLIKEFRHYSVAHGLSYLIDDILQTIPPSKVENYKPEKCIREKFLIEY